MNDARLISIAWLCVWGLSDAAWPATTGTTAIPNPRRAPAPASAAGEAGSITLEEIFVTARKVLESSSTVPLAIDVISAHELREGPHFDMSTLAELTPGLYFESFWGGSGSAPVLRGQAQPGGGGDNVGVFVDGVYQAERSAINVVPLDVERIEVVRGPQNTLFGHSTFAGAIQYITSPPTAQPAAGAEIGVGSDALTTATAYVSGPLRGGVLLGRLAAGLDETSGTARNSADYASLGDQQRTAVAGSLVSAAESPWRVTLSGRWSEATTAHPAVSTIGALQYNCGAIDPTVNAWSYYCGDLPTTRTFHISSGIPDSTNHAGQLLLSVAWEDRGRAFASDISYYRGSSDSYRDFDVSGAGETFGVCTLEKCPRGQAPPQPVNRLVQVNSISRQRPSTDELSIEARLRNVTDGAWLWLVGIAGYSANETTRSATGFERVDVLPGERLAVFLPQSPALSGPIARANSALVDDPNQEQVLQSRLETQRRTVALFGSLDYRPIGQVSMRLELRTTWERLALDSQVANFVPGFGKALAAQHFTDTTPRLSVDYAAASNMLLYVSAAKGSRSGGINPIPELLPEERSFDPEYNWTYELAGRYRGEHWQASATAFSIDWRNTQMPGYPTSPGVTNLIVRNTAGVTTSGLELAMDAKLLPNLGLHAAYSYSQPEFDAGSDDPGSSAFCGLKGTAQSSSFCTVGPSRSGNAPAGTYVPYIDGNALQRAPRQQWRLGLRSDAFSDWAGWQFDSGFDVTHQDAVYDRGVNGAYYGERTLLSAQASLTRDRWQVAIWGTNLTDENYVRAVSSRGAAFYPVTPRPLDLVYGEGRRLGITLRYDL
jgi:iron complex outermembrane receptor protein